MKQSEVVQILEKVESSIEASHRAQVELLQAVRLLFVERQAIPEPKSPREVDPDIEIAALDEATFDGLPDNTVFTVEEVAKLLRVANNTVYALVRQKSLFSLSIGRKVRIPRRALVGFLRGMDAEEFRAFIKSKSQDRASATG